MTDPRDFHADLAASKALRQESDIDTLRAMFPTCASVIKTSEADDKAGTDYIVTLRRGAQLRVDAKSRNPGSRRFWRAGPEVALEVWSVMPGGEYGTPREKSRPGWALDESKEIDLILYTFDRADHEFAYVRPLPLLRETFRRNYPEWYPLYRQTPQKTRMGSLLYQSECIFVPLVILDQAIEAMSRRKVCSGAA